MTVQDLITELNNYDLQDEVVVDGFWEDFDYDYDDNPTCEYFPMQDEPVVKKDGNRVVISLD